MPITFRLPSNSDYLSDIWNWFRQITLVIWVAMALIRDLSELWSYRYKDIVTWPHPRKAAILKVHMILHSIWEGWCIVHKLLCSTTFYNEVNKTNGNLWLLVTWDIFKPIKISYIISEYMRYGTDTYLFPYLI